MSNHHSPMSGLLSRLSHVRAPGQYLRSYAPFYHIQLVLSSFPVSLFNACAEYVHTKSAAKVQKKYDICKCIYEKRAPKRPFSAITSIFLHYLLFRRMRLFVFVEQGIKLPSTNGGVGLAIKKSTFASALPYRNDGRTTVKRR